MEVGGLRHAPFALPPWKTRFSLYRRLGGPQGRSGRVRKISTLPEFDTCTVHPVASHYTYWAIPVHTQHILLLLKQIVSLSASTAPRGLKSCFLLTLHKYGHELNKYIEGHQVTEVWLLRVRETNNCSGNCFIWPGELGHTTRQADISRVVF